MAAADQRALTAVGRAATLASLVSMSSVFRKNEVE